MAFVCEKWIYSFKQTFWHSFFFGETCSINPRVTYMKIVRMNKVVDILRWFNFISFVWVRNFYNLKYKRYIADEIFCKWYVSIYFRAKKYVSQFHATFFVIPLPIATSHERMNYEDKSYFEKKIENNECSENMRQKYFSMNQVMGACIMYVLLKQMFPYRYFFPFCVMQWLIKPSVKSIFSCEHILHTSAKVYTKRLDKIIAFGLLTIYYYWPTVWKKNTWTLPILSHNHCLYTYCSYIYKWEQMFGINLFLSNCSKRFITST